VASTEESLVPWGWLGARAEPPLDELSPPAWENAVHQDAWKLRVTEHSGGGLPLQPQRPDTLGIVTTQRTSPVGPVEQSGTGRWGGAVRYRSMGWQPPKVQRPDAFFRAESIALRDNE